MTEVVKHEGSRVIRGVVLKFVDGVWKDRDGITPPDTLMAMGTARCVQCWREQKPVDTIVETADEPLPDVEELNAKIPVKEWEDGLDGRPRPPWQLQFVIYLIDPETGSVWTYLNSTQGARIAFERLRDRFEWMRRLRGNNIAPIVKLDSRPMKTSFGTKMRPEFTVVEWRDLGSEKDAAPLQLEHQRPEGATAVATEPAPAVPTKEKKNKKVGRPVKPISLKEELNDEIGF